MQHTITHILIANRGEIAHRIIRTARRMGIRTTAVYSDADAGLPYVAAADQAVHLPGNTAAETYLRQDQLLGIARQQGADAVHPGYGFLAENAAFAKKCAEAGLRFIGPNPEAIAAMGSKSRAKAIMEEHGVPVIPGYRGEEQSDEHLLSEAKRIGYPLLIKAAAGGGGKGMRVVREEKGLATGLQAARREAEASFGNGELLLERYFTSARHIEFQIFGDQHGNVIHLLERECTIQRRHQKVIEESPSPVLTPEDREAMGAAAVRAAQALHYDNAGTVEFIHVGTNEFYFLEVNTRLQVEHPVTEAITGLDLVQMQIESAEGRPLSLRQDEVQGQGYALQCRLYAEDPANNFLPATGTIHRWHTPQVEGLRYDAAITDGSEISIFYDPMIAKVIAHGPDRTTTLRRMYYALQHLQCFGPVTNQDLLLTILADAEFQAGQYDTHYLETRPDGFLAQAATQQEQQTALIAASAAQWQQRRQQPTLLSHLPGGWRNNFYQGQQESYRLREQDSHLAYRQEGQQLTYTLQDKTYTVQIHGQQDGAIQLAINGVRNTYPVVQRGRQIWVQLPSGKTVHLEQLPRFPDRAHEKVQGGYEAPMPGQVIDVLAQAGDQVTAGQTLVILSSMKMENAITAATGGEIEEIYVTNGQQVEAGTLLLKLKEIEEPHAV